MRKHNPAGPGRLCDRRCRRCHHSLSHGLGLISQLCLSNAVVDCRRAGSRPLPISTPSRAIVVAPALVPCPSASALSCRRRRRHHHQRRRTRPADRRRPHPPSPSRQPPSSSTATIIVATKPSSAPKSPQKPTKAPWKHYLQRNPYRKKEKAVKLFFYLRHNF